MKKGFRAAAVAVVAMTVLSFSTVSFAATPYSSIADVLAKLTNKSVQEVVKERKDSGKSYGELAQAADKLEEFKQGAMQFRVDAVEQKVEAGKLTRAQADKQIANITKQYTNCDGTGDNGCGTGIGNNGVCNGTGNGNCGNGNGNGNGHNNNGHRNNGHNGNGHRNGGGHHR